MVTNDVMCVYHPVKRALAMCHQCRNLICGLDINNVKIYHDSQTYDLCFFCYNKSQHNQQKNFIGMSILAVVLAIFFFIQYNQVNTLFALLGMIIVGTPAIIVSSVSSRRMAKNITDATKRYSIGLEDTGVRGLNYQKTQNATGPLPPSHRRYPSQNVSKLQGMEAQQFFILAFDEPKGLPPCMTSVSDKICWSCGHEVFPDAIFCSHCGNIRSQEWSYI